MGSLDRRVKRQKWIKSKWIMGLKWINLRGPKVVHLSVFYCTTYLHNISWQQQQQLWKLMKGGGGWWKERTERGEWGGGEGGEGLK